jgi:hypothetical protein
MIHDLPNPGKNRAVGMLIIVVFLGSVIILIEFASGAGYKPIENMGADGTGSANETNVVPDVGNRGNTSKAWNDTPTTGMMRGAMGTKAPAGVHERGITTPVPAGIPVPDPKFCAVPTGYLRAIAMAWNNEQRTGIVESNGVLVDMGHEGGSFYDTDGDGCCDTYCRRVIKGGWWSCVDPRSITTQYTESVPRGSKCMAYGKTSAVT